VVRIERLTAADAEARQRRMAGALAARRARPGDRVALVGPSNSDALMLILGALRTGVVPVVLNPALLPAEQEALLADADPILVVREPDLAELAGGPEAELAPAPLARPMQYTSGTTRSPKGVWSGALDDASAAALVAEERDLWGFGPGDVHLVCSPFHHSAPIRFAAGTLLSGGDVVLMGRFEPAAALSVIVSERPTTAFMAPAHLQRLRAVDAEPDLSSFRLVAHAGAPCPEPIKRWALGVFPDGSVWEFYGSTEGQFTACGPDDWLARPGTVGRARPGRRLRVDEDGVVWCQPPPFARFEYWRAPEKTAEAWQDGWFTVGDVGRLDADGYLFLDGRRDDLIVSGGVNVYPVEVERVLAAMPGVRQVAVFPAADEHWGQRVCAAVVGDVRPVDVVAFAQERLAGYKCPKEVVVVDSLPVSGMGKLRRSTLAEALGLNRSPA
jgi:acyl-CoA synthetase (AMP-forming)/AMP-acid ligase II